MPDPIDELEGFTMPGTTTPLPAAEVRRRGDRIRRRNTTLAAAGGLAVVAAIAAPFAAVALDHDPRRPEPMPAPAPNVAWRQDIPRTLDLGAVPGGSPVTFTVRRDGSVIDDFTMCGRPVFSTHSDDPVEPAVEAWGAGYGEPGTSSSAARTLAVYRDADTAAAAAEGLRAGVAACPVDDRRGGPTYVWSEVPDASVAGADDGFVVAQQVQLDATTLSDLTAIEVARVGNAVLVTTTHTTAGGQQAIDGTVPNLLRLSAPVVDQMCVFAADPCAPAPQS